MQLKEITESVCDLCLKVGDFILKQQDVVREQDVEVKSLNSLVSYVDKKAEEQLIKGLSKIVPAAGFIAEEGTETKQGEIYNWVVDPLDGTTNFLHGIPVYAISVALFKNGKPIVGVVYELGKKELFSASLNGGAFLNGEAIHVSENQVLANSLLATGFPYYNFDRVDAFLDLLKTLFEKTRGVRRLGSAATDLAYVACGRFDAFFEYGLNAWDVAAGALLVQEAGGKVSDYTGGENYFFGGEIMAGSKGLYAEVLILLNSKMNT